MVTIESLNISQVLPKCQFLSVKCTLHKIFAYYAGIMLNAFDIL